MISNASKLHLRGLAKPPKLFLIALAMMLSQTSIARATELPVGPSSQKAILYGRSLDIDAFRPSGCRLRAILFVLAAKDRDNEAYRDQSIPLARAVCGVIFSPSFPLKQFPTWQYQRGGFPVRQNEIPAATLIKPMEQWAWEETQQPDLPIILIGHSAGAQFLDRVAAYAPANEVEIILMNPATYVEPETDSPVPYGFNGWPENTQQQSIKHYLAEHLTILLGSDDVETTLEAGRIAQAMGQGRNRLERGQWAYAQAREEAYRLDVPFNWDIDIVPNTGHDGPKMLASPELREAVERVISRVSSQ
ncbi:hypothetical protein [Gluconobacter cerinus]|uniref:Hydrolase n=1 Tax=Gluconobacter cerinus TaxID=38307 RepID=A0A1B6VP22_9PROT|nr:hypothetical protein [Gluconobacter cerinus]OAJ68970.1 hypothetical protein A0123_00539 [Gluconobacter cerinus]